MNRELNFDLLTSRGMG